MATTFGVSSGDVPQPFGKCEIKHYPEDATQTFKRGDLLIIGGAGVENKVKIASSNPTSGIVGIAAADASGVTGAPVPVYIAKPEFLFAVRTVADDPVDFSDIGVPVALETDATTLWRVETDDTGNDAVVVVEYRNPITRDRQASEGDTNALAIVRFVAGATIWGVNA